MASKTISRKPQPAKAGRTAPLSTVLSALMHEFTRAAAGHDATMAAWKEMYSNATIFEGKSPTGMKLVSAQVALPIAVETVTTATKVRGALTPAALTDALGQRIPKGTRQQIAREVWQTLKERNQHYLDNRSLGKQVVRVLRERFPEAAADRTLISKNLRALQEERKSLTPDPPEAQVIYRAKDLAQLSPERIIILNLDYKLE